MDTIQAGYHISTPLPRADRVYHRIVGTCVRRGRWMRATLYHLPRINQPRLSHLGIWGFSNTLPVDEVPYLNC